ncbi:MAG TPA: hypothetical protein VK764_06400 [Terracidiphilus sp.]|jgi:hypothetical protein|nr:hypothetical protein [Terracidiphilus sp.]
MKWVWDKTNRFRMRPHYSTEELDAQCETILSEYLQKKYSDVSFPVKTDDLLSLLQRDTRRLDLNADFTTEGGQIEGLIEFRRGQKPVVRIAAQLRKNPGLEDRFRAALMHEYAHVRFHDFLFQTEEASCLSLFEDFPDALPQTNRCHRESILPLNDRDWMEWQAGFVCGALLLPIGPLIKHVRHFRHARDLDHAALSDRSLDGAALIREVAEKFGTSWEVARVRLLQEKILASGDMRSLF